MRRAQHHGLRLLLLTLVILGVAAMHTLGHPGTGHAAMPGAAPMGAATAAHPPPAMIPAAVTGTVAAGVGMGTDPMDVCLAILTALAVVLLVGLVRGFRRRPGGAGEPAPSTWPAAGRGPPPRGLLLADLSVLRI